MIKILSQLTLCFTIAFDQQLHLTHTRLRGRLFAAEVKLNSRFVNSGMKYLASRPPCLATATATKHVETWVLWYSTWKNIWVVWYLKFVGYIHFLFGHINLIQFMYASISIYFWLTARWSPFWLLLLTSPLLQVNIPICVEYNLQISVEVILGCPNHW